MSRWASSPTPVRSIRSRARATTALREAVRASLPGSTTLSSSVRFASRWACWNTNPKRVRRSRASCFCSSSVSSVPSREMLPPSVSSIPDREYSRVDFPLPEGPMIARNSPLPTSRSISWSTGWPDRTRRSRRAVSTVLIGSSSFRGQSADARLRGGANGQDGDGGGHRGQQEGGAGRGEQGGGQQGDARGPLGQGGDGGGPPPANADTHHP